MPLARDLRKAFLAGRGYDHRILFHRDSVAVFPRLGLVLNRIKKSGNSSVTAFLNDLEGGPRHATIQQMKHTLTRLEDLSLAATLGLPRLYSLAVVRDPYARLLSGFLHHIAPGTAEKHAMVPGYGDAGPTGFRAFVRYLADGHLHFNRHFHPQTDLLFQPPARFSRIARLERIVPEMREVLSALGQDPARADRLSAQHDLERKQAHKITDARAHLARFYDDPTRDLARALYAADFAAFGYDARRRAAVAASTPLSLASPDGLGCGGTPGQDRARP